MNISQLEYFIASVNRRSFAEAAKMLYVSPQAVSKAISDLEKEFHLDLFIKSGRGIEPTAYGKLLAERAEEVLLCCDDLKNIAGSFLEDNGEVGLRGSIRIAVTSSPFEGSIISHSIFENYSHIYPNVQISLNYSSSGSCLAALQEGVVDAAIILGRYSAEGLKCTKIFDCALEVAVGNNNPLSLNKSTRLLELSKFPIAKHHDLRYCLPTIESHFYERNLSPLFVDLAPTIKEYARFFSEQSGIVFVVYEKSLDSSFSDVSFVELDCKDQIKIPICFIYSTKGDSRLSLSLLKYFTKKVRNNSLRNRG